MNIRGYGYPRISFFGYPHPPDSIATDIYADIRFPKKEIWLRIRGYLPVFHQKRLSASAGFAYPRIVPLRIAANRGWISADSGCICHPRSSLFMINPQHK